MYSIGEVSKICNVSKKTLRFYDEIGLISPDVVSEENNYRFYSKDTLLFVPVIKYYKQMGFKLEEMRDSIQGNSYIEHERRFLQKIEELNEQEKQIRMAHLSVCEWHKLIKEASSVIKNNVTDVSIKYLEPMTTCYMEQTFKQNYKASIINIEWTNYLEEKKQPIIGAVNLWFESFSEKNKGNHCNCRIFQKSLTEEGDIPMMSIGGNMVASCYHIGSHETLYKTYDKIIKWAEKHGYEYSEESVERYVTDYWTIQSSEEFVTEIMIKVQRK